MVHLLRALAIAFVFMSGTAQAAYTPNVVTSAAVKQRIERFAVTSTCTTGSCTIASQSGGVASITHNTTGDYTVNFTSGIFSAAMTCVLLVNGGGAFTIRGPTAAVTSTTYRFQSENGGSDADSTFSGICMGAR